MNQPLPHRPAAARPTHARDVRYRLARPRHRQHGRGRGNLASDGTTTYSYDVDNHLVSSNNGTSLAWDAIGRLRETQQGSTTTRLLYAGEELIAEYDGAGAVVARYVHGAGIDEPLVWYVGSGTGTRRWLAADERGSIASITDAAGNVIAINTYDEYGKPGPNNQGRFQYTGQQWIAELALYHYKARFYAPQIGRFLQTDPIGYEDQMNLYAYVGGDPVNATDPSGLECVTADGYENVVCDTKAETIDAIRADVAARQQPTEPGKTVVIREYGGYIDTTPDGKFTYSIAPGKSFEGPSSEIYDSLRTDSSISVWHSHPSYDDSRGQFSGQIEGEPDLYKGYEGDVAFSKEQFDRSPNIQDSLVIYDDGATQLSRNDIALARFERVEIGGVAYFVPVWRATPKPYK